MIDCNGKTPLEVVKEVMPLIVEQGGKCENETTCLYGDDEGRHCAVGWLLPWENEELMSVEGDVTDLIRRYPDLGPNDAWIRENEGFLNTLQDIHDLQWLDTQEKISEMAGLLGDLGTSEVEDILRPWFKLNEVEL